MNANTKKIMDAMVSHANAGNDVIPMFFQPRLGTSNSVSAAIRAAKRLGLLVQNGLDGCGKPKYAAPIKTATHNGNSAIN